MSLGGMLCSGFVQGLGRWAGETLLLQQLHGPHPCPPPQGSASSVHPGSLSFLSGQPGLGQGASRSAISVQLCPMTAVPWKRYPLLPSRPRRHLKATSLATFLLLGSVIPTLAGARPAPFCPFLPFSSVPPTLRKGEADLSPGPTVD